MPVQQYTSNINSVQQMQFTPLNRWKMIFVEITLKLWMLRGICVSANLRIDTRKLQMNRKHSMTSTQFYSHVIVDTDIEQCRLE